MSTEVKKATSATWNVAGNRDAVVKAWLAAGGSVTAWLKTKPAVKIGDTAYPAPAYATIVKWAEYQAVAGGGSATIKAPVAGAALNVASILAESKRQLTEGRKELDKRKAALLAQVETTEAAIREIDETLAKLG